MSNLVTSQDRVWLWLSSLEEPDERQQQRLGGQKLNFPRAIMAPSTPPTSTPARSARLPCRDAGGAPRDESPPKRQRTTDEHDHDRPPRSLHDRPILKPVAPAAGRARSPSPKHVETVGDLVKLEKPVTRSAGFRSLPDNLTVLYQKMQDTLASEAFVPGAIQDEFSALMLGEHGQKARNTWFAEAPPPTSQATRGRQAQLGELDRLVAIYRKAAESIHLKRHEAAWNSTVHQPMLELSFDRDYWEAAQDGAKLHVRVENVTSATISGDCVPRLVAGDDDAASIGAWSVSQVSGCSSSSSSSSGSSEDGFFYAEEEEQSRPGASSPRQQPPIPLDRNARTRSNSKKVDFALVVVPERGTRLEEAITADMVGPFELGSTKTLAQSYMLLTNLRYVGAWIYKEFCPALEEWLTI